MKGHFILVFKIWHLFKGNISSMISGLTSLEYIDLSHNVLEGLSFPSFANISKLEFIRFACSSTKLDIETENSGWVPLFQLKFIAISNCSLNKLSNQIPTFSFTNTAWEQLIFHTISWKDLSLAGYLKTIPSYIIIFFWDLKIFLFFYLIYFQ